MKIALKNGDTNYWLAGQPEVAQSVHSSAGNLQFSGTINIQQQGRVRAAGMAFRDRRNLGETVAFTTSRKFATTDEADEWSATYSAVFPRTGYLDLYNESDEIIARLDNAIVQPPVRTVIGVSVQLSYTVIGGAMLVPDGEGAFETPEMMMGGEVVTME